jgi:beta-phosphoglucomutase
MNPAILFDFNGVIVDDEPQHCEALITTLAEYGFPLDRETYYRDYLGFDDRECFRFTFARHRRPLDPAMLHEAIERKNLHYERALRASMTLVPGVGDFVAAAARSGRRLGIVSGALRREIDLVLELAGLRRHFAEIVAAEDVTACKPDPQGYRKGAAALGVAAERCVVVEDSLPGLAAARAAGMSCVMLATSHSVGALADADLVWNDFIGHDPSELVQSTADAARGTHV